MRRLIELDKISFLRTIREVELNDKGEVVAVKGQFINKCLMRSCDDL